MYKDYVHKKLLVWLIVATIVFLLFSYFAEKSRFKNAEYSMASTFIYLAVDKQIELCIKGYETEKEKCTNDYYSKLREEEKNRETYQKKIEDFEEASEVTLLLAAATAFIAVVLALLPIFSYINRKIVGPARKAAHLKNVTARAKELNALKEQGVLSEDEVAVELGKLAEEVGRKA
jgi:uncharacterized membrane protein (GlpM family)